MDVKRRETGAAATSHGRPANAPAESVMTGVEPQNPLALAPDEFSDTVAPTPHLQDDQGAPPPPSRVASDLWGISAPARREVDVRGGTAEYRENIRLFAASVLGLPQDEVTTSRLEDGHFKGLTGAPVLRIYGADKDLPLGVAKVFHTAPALMREVDTMQRLQGLGPGAPSATQVLGVGKAILPEASRGELFPWLNHGVKPPPSTEGGVLLMTCAKGIVLDDFVLALKKAVGPRARAAALSRAEAAYCQFGRRLAKLHQVRGGRPDGFLEREVRNIMSCVSWIEQRSQTLRDFGVDVDAIARRAVEIVAAARANPGVASLMQGDCNPGNAFVDEATGGVEVVDLEQGYRSFDDRGHPIGMGASDYVWFLNHMFFAPKTMGCSEADAQSLADAFARGHDEAGGGGFTEEAVELFRAQTAIYGFGFELFFNLTETTWKPELAAFGFQRYLGVLGLERLP